MSDTELMIDKQIAEAAAALETLRATLTTVGEAVPNPHKDAFAWGHLAAAEEIKHSLAELDDARDRVLKIRQHATQQNAASDAETAPRA